MRLSTRTLQAFLALTSILLPTHLPSITPLRRTALLTLLPENTSVLHIGLFREKVSLQPVEYYNKVRVRPAFRTLRSGPHLRISSQLPAEPNVDSVFILDPLIATGGTAIVSLFSPNALLDLLTFSYAH